MTCPVASLFNGWGYQSPERLREHLHSLMVEEVGKLKPRLLEAYRRKASMPEFQYKPEIKT